VAEHKTDSPIQSINIPVEQMRLEGEHMKPETLKSHSLSRSINKNQASLSDIQHLISKEQISHKLVMGTCRSISSIHAILKFCTEIPDDCSQEDSKIQEPEGFYIKALAPMTLNKKLIYPKDGFFK